MTEMNEQSEIEPTIGRMVHYYPTHHELIQYEGDTTRIGGRMASYKLGATPIPGIVVSVHNGDRVNLRLLLDTPLNPPHVVHVPFSSTAKVGAWSWPPQAKRRTRAA